MYIYNLSQCQTRLQDCYFPMPPFSLNHFLVSKKGSSQYNCIYSKATAEIHGARNSQSFQFTYLNIWNKLQFLDKRSYSRTTNNHNKTETNIFLRTKQWEGTSFSFLLLPDMFLFLFFWKLIFISPTVSLKRGRCPAIGQCSLIYFWGTCVCVCVCGQPILPFLQNQIPVTCEGTVIMNYGSFARSDTKLVSGPVSNVGVNLWQTGYWWMVSKVCWICQPRLWMRIC